MLKQHRNFPLLTVMVLVTAVIFSGINWNIYTSVGKQHHTRAIEHKLQRLTRGIAYLDDVLTMSTNMVIATGDMSWESYYLSMSSRLNIRLEELSSYSSLLQEAASINNLNLANNNLVALEKEVFKLVSVGQMEKANQLFESSEYTNQKRNYAEALNKINSAVENFINNAEVEVNKHSTWLFISINIALGLLMITWLFTMTFLKKNLVKSEQNEQMLLYAQNELEQRVEERTALIKLLYSISQMASNSDSITRLMEICLEKICAHTGWPIGHVYMLDEKSAEVMRPTTCWYIQEPDKHREFHDITMQTLFDKGVGLPGRVMVSRQPVYVVDVSKDSNFPRAKLMGKSDLHSAFGLPVIVQGKVVAVLEFFSEETIPPKQEFMDVLEQIGEQISHVFERKDSEQKILEAKKSAEEANYVKSQFLANMSHELRTPLNAIIGYGEILIEDAREDGQDYLIPDLEKIISSGKHLLDLVNDVLDLSRLESGKVELDAKVVALDSFVQEMVELVTPLIGKNGNRLEVIRSENLGEIINDPSKLKQILFQLLNNASKFTEEGEITLSVNRLKENNIEMIEFRVADSGIGITPKIKEKLFQPFIQADTTSTRKYDGTGLGLAIVKSYIDMMQGKIYVDTEPGKGSIFTIVLPVEINSDNNKKDIIVTTEAVEVVGQLSTASKNKGTVLIIDDESDARGLLSHYLTRAGWKVITANNGTEGIMMARKFKPDAITLDVLMEGIDGWDVLEVLKADPDLDEIPVVMCTIVNEKRRGLALGAVDYLVKPIQRTEFLATLERFSNGGLKHLLIVEDDVNTRELVSRTASKQGWEVSEAGNGEEAINILSSKEPPDLILLDLMMPKVDGFSFVEAIQKNKEWKTIPIVVMTAKDLTDNDRLRLNSFVDVILEKGQYSKQDLLTEVSSRLDRLMNIHS